MHSHFEKKDYQQTGRLSIYYWIIKSALDYKISWIGNQTWSLTINNFKRHCNARDHAHRRRTGGGKGEVPLAEILRGGSQTPHPEDFAIQDKKWKIEKVCPGGEKSLQAQIILPPWPILVLRPWPCQRPCCKCDGKKGLGCGCKGVREQ